MKLQLNKYVIHICNLNLTNMDLYNVTFMGDKIKLYNVL